MSDLDDLRSDVSQCPVFGIATKVSHNWLYRGTPGYQITTNNDGVSILGATSFNATSSIDI